MSNTQRAAVKAATRPATLLLTFFLTAIVVAMFITAGVTTGDYLYTGLFAAALAGLIAVDFHTTRRCLDRAAELVALRAAR